MITILIGSAIVVAIAMATTFVIGEKLKRHNVVDVAWGAAFAAVAIVAAVVGTGDGTRRWLLAAFVVVWGLRLAGYLAARSRGHGEDPRYEALLAKASGSRRAAIILRIYVLQGALVWFISLPVQFSASVDSPLGALAIVGIALWCIGFGFESIGDAQLRAFKRNPANRGQVMDRGLWRLTRHPNYFGDAAVWWGLFLITVSGAPWIWLGILSPLVMTTLLVRVSGKSLLERHMSNRPGYAEYVARTSGFLPWPPRRVA